MLLRRSITVCALVALSAAPLSAQMKTGASHDPDIKAGGGALPSGWSGRTDRADAKLEDAKFVTMGQGFHVTSGPRGDLLARRERGEGSVHGNGDVPADEGADASGGVRPLLRGEEARGRRPELCLLPRPRRRQGAS